MRSSSQLKIQQTLELTGHNDFDALFKAIDKDDVVALQQLIDHGAKVKKAKRNGKAAVLVAAEAGHWGCVEVMLYKLKPDMLIMDDLFSDSTRKFICKLGEVLLLAAKANQADLLQQWFGKYRVWPGDEGCFFVHEIGYLTGHKVWQDAETRNTALHFAVLNDNIEFIIEVIELRGVTFGLHELLQTKNKDNETFLDLAFRLQKTHGVASIIDADHGRRYRHKHNNIIKHCDVATLFGLLQMDLHIGYTKRQASLLKYMLTLPDGKKTKALQDALNATTTLGRYMEACEDKDDFKRKMRDELQQLATSSATLPYKKPS